MIENDKLLIAIEDKIFAVSADEVVAVVEAERFFMLPIINPVKGFPVVEKEEPQMKRVEKGPKSSLSYLRPGFIKGIITWRGDVVVVIDIGELFGISPLPAEGPYRVVVIKKDTSILGILAYNAAEVNAAEKDEEGISFIWKEELDKLEFKPANEDYTIGWIDPAGKKIRLVDWQKILEVIQNAVSGRG